MSSAFHIHIGGAGVMMGDMLWKLYEKEHNETTQKNYIYDQVEQNYHPLALFADVDDRMIYEVQRNKQIKFKKHSFIYGNEDTSNVYSRGIYTVGKAIIWEGMDCIRKQIETMDRLDQFLITTSISGGTGSGFSSLLMSMLNVDYGNKVKKTGFTLFPSSQMSNNVLEIYNAMFSIFMTREHFDNIIMFDNQSMYNVIDQQLDLDYVDYSHLNNVIAQIISSYTGLRRFNNIDNSKFFQNMCPYPALHYFIPSYGRMSLINDYTRKKQNQTEFIKYLTQKEIKLYQCPKSPQHLSTTLLFRQQEENNFYGKFDLTLQNLEHIYKQNPRVFQCNSANYQILSELAEMKQTGVFFSNDASIISRFKLLGKKFDQIYAKRAFVWVYIAEGLEEREFNEGRQNLDYLEQTYSEIINAPDSQNQSNLDYEL
ncbi:unnamed protein product [Paramecium pentaurelia]|uniref:Tubulin/FtsZ GTPase domain-containing protein n=1 Tax=Paramecium pentaurelia TaxID=43138 RepID=A0A8S1UU73_9CILI|nr:unnamed protein product [Paramecium pentaurelia]